MKTTSTIALFLVLSTTLWSQKGQVSGTIETDDNKPAAFVNVGIKNLDVGTSTNEQGEYTIANIPAEKHTLVASYVGLEQQTLTFELESGETKQLPTITLEASKRELKEVVVEYNRAKYYDRESEYVAKMPLKKMENPQVYNSIGAQLLEDQVVTNFDDALKNSPGTYKLWESTGRGSDGSGYYSLRGFPVQPKLVNGLPGLTNGLLDPANVRRIEIIKGPSGTLYGSSLVSYGGLINVVTKKPYHSLGGKLSYNVGSFGLNRITADINTPLNKDKTAALRLNSAYHKQNSFQDAGFQKSLFLAPSFSYKVNDRLSFTINTEFYDSEHTNQTMLFLNRYTSLKYENLEELNYNPSRSYTSNDITIENPAYNLQGEMRYELSENWTSQTVISSSTAKADGYYTYLWDLADGNGSFSRFVSDQNSTTLTTDVQQNVTGDFKVLGLRNRMVVGVDYYRQTVINNSTGYVGYDVVQIGSPDATQLTRTAVDTALASAGVTKTQTSQATYSAYISDVINITPSLAVMASVRLDHFDNLGTKNAAMDTITGDYSQTALSPKFGIMYQPIPDQLALFANYMNGFSNVGPRVQGDGSVQSFQPEQANQWEAGVKANLWEDKLSATVSYYNILVSNVVRQDPEQVNFYVQDGENYSRGIEATVTATPLTGLNLLLGYSHNESEITKTDNEDYANRRPESAGPKDLFNGWVNYRIPNGKLSGLGFGLGAYYASENLILNRKTTGQFALPAYTIVDATIYYEMEHFRIALKANNLTDKEYYKGWSTINPQQPRNFTANISFRF